MLADYRLMRPWLWADWKSTCFADFRRYLHGGNRVDRPAIEASKLKDTVGAGDAFVATLLASVSGIGKKPISELRKASGNPLVAMPDRAAMAAAPNFE